MENNLNPKQGDIFWLKPPSPRESKADYSHPCVIIQDDIINCSRIETVVVCALTSNKNRGNEPGNILLDADEGNLPLQSVVIVSQIETVNKKDLGKLIGSLSQKRVQQILSGMRFQQRTFFER